MTHDDTEALIALIRSNLYQWGVEEAVSIKLLTRSENATFIVEDGKQRKVVRAYRPDYHSDAEITSELLWLQAIENSAIVPVPHLFTSASGQLFIHAGTQRFACFSFMAGYEPVPGRDLVRWFTKLGEISARLHHQSIHWQKPDNFTRKHWTYQTMIGEGAYWGDWRRAEGLSDDDRQILQCCDDKLAQTTTNFPRDPSHYGLIHGDLRLANLLVDDERLVAIDFDDCGFSWFGLDLANAISFIEDDPIVPDLIEAWFEGYQKVASVSPQMRLMLPHLIMMRRLQLTAWLASHSEVPTAIALQPTYAKVTVALATLYLQQHGCPDGRQLPRL